MGSIRFDSICCHRRGAAALSTSRLVSSSCSCLVGDAAHTHTHTHTHAATPRDAPRRAARPRVRTIDWAGPRRAAPRRHCTALYSTRCTCGAAAHLRCLPACLLSERLIPLRTALHYAVMDRPAGRIARFGTQQRAASHRASARPLAFISALIAVFACCCCCCELFWRIDRSVDRPVLAPDDTVSGWRTRGETRPTVRSACAAAAAAVLVFCGDVPIPSHPIHSAVSAVASSLSRRTAGSEYARET